jgi:hypothetical protein
MGRRNRIKDLMEENKQENSDRKSNGIRTLWRRIGRGNRRLTMGRRRGIRTTIQQERRREGGIREEKEEIGE